MSAFWMVKDAKCYHADNEDSSRKHAFIILTALNPILYSNLGVYRGMNFSLFF